MTLLPIRRVLVCLPLVLAACPRGAEKGTGPSEPPPILATDTDSDADADTDADTDTDADADADADADTDTDTDTEPTTDGTYRYDSVGETGDTGLLTVPPRVDLDGDGFSSFYDGGTDCDDTDRNVYPGAPEYPYDGVDQDCVDGDLVDIDGDGVDAPQAGGTDCADTDAGVFPGARDDVGDGVDQSCDGVDGTDADRDGVASDFSGGADCDDGDAGVNPGRAEVWYDGVDQDCDGACDGDQDGDGWVLTGWVVRDADPCDTVGGPSASAPVDCDDTNPAGQAPLLSVAPTAGTVGFAVDGVVSATLAAQDPSAVLTLEDAAGVAVAGASAWSGATLTFTPAADLRDLETYTATLDWGCGEQQWTFTTETSAPPPQVVTHFWTEGAPDLLTVEVTNPVATTWLFAMAETQAGAVGWYGEDCVGAFATGDCHPMSGPILVLESVYPRFADVEAGLTTIFDSSFDPAITFYLEALDGAQAGTCWTWGEDPSYYPGCTPL